MSHENEFPDGVEELTRIGVRIVQKGVNEKGNMVYNLVGTDAHFNLIKSVVIRRMNDRDLSIAN